MIWIKKGRGDYIQKEILEVVIHPISRQKRLRIADSGLPTKEMGD